MMAFGEARRYIAGSSGPFEECCTRCFGPLSGPDALKLDAA
jgi:hypothetical protein